MKKLNSYFILSVCGSFLLQSCYVLKPDSSGVSAPDYNQRIEITNPHYNRVMSPTGYGVLAASIVAGGYAGMQAKIVQTQKGTARVDNKPVNAIIGAAIGFGINMLGNKMFAKERRVPATDFFKWVKETNPAYLPFKNNGKDYFVINNSVEGNFSIRALNDVVDFNAAFPNSDYFNKVIFTASNTLSREELSKMIELFPTSLNIKIAKEQYIKKSQNVEELVSASRKYQNSGLDIEAMAFEKVTDKTEAIAFNNYFPGSKKINDVFKIGLRKTKEDDYPDYINNFKSVDGKLIDEAKIEYLNTRFSVRGCYAASQKYPDLLKMAEARAANKLLKSSGDFEDFLGLFINSSMNRDVESRYTSFIRNEFNDLPSGDQLSFYNFYQKYKNSNNKNGIANALMAYNEYRAINEKNLAKTELALKKSDGYTLVKIVYKTLDGSPAMKHLNTITKWMSERRKKSYDLGNLIGITDANKEKNFDSIDDEVTYYETGVINASWYRAGTEKDGDWLTQNSGFPKFKEDFFDLATSLNIKVEMCEYLGSYSDDERRAAQRRQAEIEYKQKKDNCHFDQLEWEMADRRAKYNNSIYGSIKVKWKFDADDNSYSIDVNGYPSGYYFSEDNEVRDGVGLLSKKIGNASSLDRAIEMILKNRFCN